MTHGVGLGRPGHKGLEVMLHRSPPLTADRVCHLKLIGYHMRVVIVARPPVARKNGFVIPLANPLV